MEVSLLPVVVEEKSVPKLVPPVMKPQIKEEKSETHFEKKEETLQVNQKEEPVQKQELAPEYSPPIQAEVKPAPPSHNIPAPSSHPEAGKIVIASQGIFIPNLPSSGSSDESVKRVSKYPSSSEGEIRLAQPRYAENPKPLYPPEARKKGYEGEVVLKVEVLTDGRVGQIEVRKSSGHQMLDLSALHTVKQWRFIPAKNGEDPINLWVNIPIKYQLQ
jgi:protein TonB